MKNLNLSNDAADFITKLDKQQASPIWQLIQQLLEESQLDVPIQFADGRRFFTLNEFIIIFRYVEDNLNIDVIGRRFEAFAPGAPNLSIGQGLDTTARSDDSSAENGFAELFTLSFCLLTFVLALGRWFNFDLNILDVSSHLPLAFGLAGAALGIWRRSELLFRFTPIVLLITVSLAIAIGHFGPSEGLLLLGATMMLLALPLCFGACLGSQIGNLFTRLGPAMGFASILPGILLAFLAIALSSGFFISPTYQIAIVPLVLLLAPSQKFKMHIGLAICLVLSALALLSPLSKTALETRFSPYHKIALHKAPNNTNPSVAAVVDDTLQEVLSPDGIGINSDPVIASRTDFSRLPFAFKHPSSVLVVNAGIGIDVQECLKQGVASIVAVEKDPILLKLGRRFNEAYRAKTVHIRNEDPRCFLQNSQQKYDMIIFSLEDFVAPLGLGTKVQYSPEKTRQIYQDCLSHLTPGGLLLVSFATPTYNNSQWLRDRIYATLKEASGVSPLLLVRSTGANDFAPYLFVTAKDGSPRDVPQNLASDFPGYGRIQMPETVEGKAATDDCPYVYFRPGFSDGHFILCTLFLIAIVGWFGQSYVFSKADLHSNWQSFFLNAGLVSMVLGVMPRLVALYGSDWISSAIIYSAILMIAWFTNSSIRKPGIAQYELILYVGLFVSLIISYFLPVPWLSSFGTVGKVVIVFFTALPLFRVLLILPGIFSESREPTILLSFSILGLVAGLLLSYISYYLGQNVLLLISMALFGISLLLCIGGQKALIPPVAKLATKRIT